MRVQEGSLNIQIHLSTVSLSGFCKPTTMFDSPTCYLVQEKDNKATPPPHLNAPTLRMTNGVTTTSLKRWRMMQDQETMLPINTSMHNFVSRTFANVLQCSITLHTTVCTRKIQEDHSYPSSSVQNKQCDKSEIDKGKQMQVQKGALHKWINLPSMVSLSDFHKLAAVFDSPTCCSVQVKESKATPPPHLNDPTLCTTNGVTTTSLKRWRIMQRARDGPPNQPPCTTFSLGHL